MPLLCIIIVVESRNKQHGVFNKDICSKNEKNHIIYFVIFLQVLLQHGVFNKDICSKNEKNHIIYFVIFLQVLLHCWRIFRKQRRIKKINKLNQ
jgi:hypothetical protein